MSESVIRKIIVLGGGSAGLMCAGALKLYLPHLHVVCIRSKDIGVIGVGEGSTIALTDFLHSFLRVKPQTFFSVARPTWKLGLRFLWGPRPQFHYGFGSQADNRVSSLVKSIGFMMGGDQYDNWDPYCAMMARDKVFPTTPAGAPAVHLDLSYHFENEKFVNFLEGYAAAVGVEFVDDTLERVERNDHGVSGLVLRSGRTETAGLYIDASGFGSLLLGKALEVPFESFKTSLFCDRAVVGGWDRTDEVIRPYTTCETMPSGWCWQIEHEARINRGYVYSSAFITDEQAERQFREKCPRVSKTRVVPFTSGRYRDGWNQNVIAVGNSSGFVEPLEATALGVIAIQSRLIVGSLVDSECTLRPSHIREFNHHHRRLWDNIRGFIAVHYKFNTRLDTPFWRECQEKTDLGVAAPIVDYYQENGPSNFWAPTLIDPVEPFKMGGYVTLLKGMDVPHRPSRHTPSQDELNWWQNWQARNADFASRAIDVRQSLRAIHSPQWQWGQWSSGKLMYAG